MISSQTRSLSLQTWQGCKQSSHTLSFRLHMTILRNTEGQCRYAHHIEVLRNVRPARSSHSISALMETACSGHISQLQRLSSTKNGTHPHSDRRARLLCCILSSSEECCLGKFKWPDIHSAPLSVRDRSNNWDMFETFRLCNQTRLRDHSIKVCSVSTVVWRSQNAANGHAEDQTGLG